MEIYACVLWPGAKNIKKNTNPTQNKSQTHRAIQYEVTSFLSTDCELSTETCSKKVYSLGPRFNQKNGQLYFFFSYSGGGLQWFAVVCGGLPALSLVTLPIGILSSQIMVVICGGLR